MLFEKRFWAGLADGSITVTFRRWQRPRVIAGRSYRTAGRILDVIAVTEVDTESITEEDAAGADTRTFRRWSRTCAVTRTRRCTGSSSGGRSGRTPAPSWRRVTS